MKKTGLIIEDHIMAIKILTNFLSDKYELYIATTGKLAIEKIQGKRFDFIISDLGLPDIPGEKVIKEIKKSPLNAKTPIIIYSAHINDEESKLKYHELGVTSMVAKGDPRALLKNIEHLFPEDKEEGLFEWIKN